jgi:hypothetical protein
MNSLCPLLRPGCYEHVYVFRILGVIIQLYTKVKNKLCLNTLTIADTESWTMNVRNIF